MKYGTIYYFRIRWRIALGHFYIDLNKLLTYIYKYIAGDNTQWNQFQLSAQLWLWMWTIGILKRSFIYCPHMKPGKCGEYTSLSGYL